jgi:oligopeptide/dipeptide ABC transporter ATP-binding protein
MSTVVFNAVTKTYGQTVAVKDLSLEIAEEEFFVIVGPSGAGKTTTLKLTAGLLPLTSGKLYIGGQLANSLSPAERNTAMTFESYALYPHMTVYENIGNPLHSPGAKLNESEIRSRVIGIAELLGIGQLLDRYQRELSGGQKQRVSVARAIISDPDVIVLDEPTSSIDVSIQAQVLNLLIELQKLNGYAYVLITHDPNVARYMADRIIVMYLGKVVEDGPATSVLSRPKHPYTQALLSSAPKLGETDIPAVIKGEPPSLINLPPGCPYAPRCPYAFAVCTEREPGLYEVEGVSAACYLYDKDAVSGAANKQPA